MRPPWKILNFDLHADKTAFVAESSAGTTVCKRATYTFGDGVLTIETDGPGAAKDLASYKAELPSDDTLRLDDGRVKADFRRAPLPPGACKF